MVKGKILLTQEGGSPRTEIRPNRTGAGWYLLDFEYDETGKRKKLDERKVTDNAQLIELLEQDKLFYDQLVGLAQDIVGAVA